MVRPAYCLSHIMGEPGYFVFAHAGTMIFLDRKTYSVMETPLYSLDDFSTVIG
jgi:hypothetical protein